jgi:2-hydroxychromene-2-carboxylate isomerase
LTEKLFSAYWVEGRDVTDDDVLLQIAKESGISSAKKLDKGSFTNGQARKELETSTAKAIDRGAFGVPGFWIPGANWIDVNGENRTGRFFWGQDRMHFVEATLVSLRTNSRWSDVPGIANLMPRCVPYGQSRLSHKVKLEFWYDFSSPWAFLGYTQLARLQRTFGSNLEIILKPFLLGILFREIGAPNMPILAVSSAKAAWSRQDHADWTAYWNAVNASEGGKDKSIEFHWAEVFPIRTPTVLRVAIVEPKTVPLLCKLSSMSRLWARFLRPADSACWEQNANVSDDKVLAKVLDQGGYDGASLLAKANDPLIKNKLRENTAAAKAIGICGVPTYRILQEYEHHRFEPVGGLVWGQDETNVVVDMIAGWDSEKSTETAEPLKANTSAKSAAKL